MVQRRESHPSLGRLAMLFALLLLVVLGSGCKKPAHPAAPLLPLPVENLARIDWLGLERLAGETNATNFIAIWSLPESRKLAAQTFDKLAIGLLTGGRGRGTVISYPSLAPKHQSPIANHSLPALRRFSAPCSMICSGRSPLSMCARRRVSRGNWPLPSN